MSTSHNGIQYIFRAHHYTYTTTAMQHHGQINTMAVFRNPASPQERVGGFGKVPIELRQMILRNLLAHDGPIEDGNELTDTEHNRTRGIHPRVLGICQLLYQEGMHILYQENTLKIRCVFENDFQGLFVNEDDYKCHILEGSFHVPASIQAAESRNSSLTAIAQYSDKSESRWIHQNSSVLHKFSKIQLDIPLDNPEFVYTCCHVLAPLLKDKHVVVQPSIDQEGTPATNAPIHRHSTTCARALSAFQVLRCRSFVINGIQVPDKILSIVTGSIPAPSIFERWIQFKDSLRLDMSFTNDAWVFFDKHEDETAPVYEAMMNYDEIRFELYIGNLRRVARDWTKAAIQSYSKIMQRVTQLSASVVDNLEEWKEEDNDDDMTEEDGPVKEDELMEDCEPADGKLEE